MQLAGIILLLSVLRRHCHCMFSMLEMEDGVGVYVII